MAPCTGPILVIEDDADIRVTLEQILQLEGYQAYTAENGKEGMLKLSEIERPCLILLDLMMPVMNGWEFMDAISHTPHSEIPVVVVTAAPLEAERRKPRSVAVLKKPLEVDTLLHAIHQFCDQPGARL